MDCRTYRLPCCWWERWRWRAGGVHKSWPQLDSTKKPEWPGWYLAGLPVPLIDSWRKDNMAHDRFISSKWPSRRSGKENLFRTLFVGRLGSHQYSIGCISWRCMFRPKMSLTHIKWPCQKNGGSGWNKRTWHLPVLSTALAPLWTHCLLLFKSNPRGCPLLPGFLSVNWKALSNLSMK